MKPAKYILLLITFIFCIPSYSKNDWEKIKEIEKNIISPQFLDKNYNILEFGAKQDGEFDCRPAINSAISKCSENGGGKVIVPIGKYYIGGSILMKSNVNLHFQEGCEFVFSSRSEDYLPLVLTRWEGTELYNYSPLIYAYNAVNIAITGKGRLDGNGTANFANWKPNQRKAQQALREMGRMSVPVEKRIFGENQFLRPAFIEFFSCNNILIEDISITNSPFWVIHPIYCNNVTVKKVNINSKNLNSDGCDPESSSNVLIEDCHFITGDDGIAIKAGRDNDAWRVGRPTENVIIRNSIFQSTTNGVCIGSEISGGVRNVYVENVKVPKANNAIYFKSNLDRGGYINHIRVRNIDVDSVGSSVIKFEPDYKSESKENYPTLFQDFVLENLSCNFAGEYGADVSGFEKKPVQEVLINNLNVKNARQPYRIKHAEGVELKNGSINGKLVEFGLSNKVISLNGVWDVTISELKPEKYSSKVSVPGIITMATPSLGKDLDGIDSTSIPYNYIWYKYNFKLDEVNFPKAILHIRAKYNATVWLNGTEIGYDPYCTYSHAEFDISKALKLKGQNELVVRVGSWNTASSPSKENPSEWWRNTRAPGIWDDIWIDLGQTIAINHIKILPDTKNTRILGKIEVKNSASSNFDLTVSVTIFDENKKLIATQQVLKTDQNSINTTKFELPANMLTFWSPGKEGNPKLYRLNVKIFDASDNLLSDKNEIFGYRNIEIKGKDVLLNGQKIIFRAENIAFVRSLTRWKDFMFDENHIREFLRSVVRDYNFNYLRIHLGHAYSKWYEIADQEGIMLQDEWRYMHDEEPLGKDKEEAVIEFNRWVRENVNHPSIVAWDQENEGNVRLEDLIQELRKYDPTRLWEQQDYVAKHNYQYSENMVTSPTYQVPESKPMTILESCRLWTNEFGALEPRENFKTSRTASGWGIYYYNKELMGQLLADIHADLGTNFRILRYQAWAPFALLSGWINGQNFFYDDMTKSLNPQPNLLVLKKINEPVGVSIDMLQAREWYKDKVIYKSGTNYIKNVCVWNDFLETQKGEITLKVKNLTGETFSCSSAEILVSAYQCLKQKMSFKTPVKDGIYLLEPTLLLKDGRTIEGPSRRIMVASNITKEIEEVMGFGGNRTRIKNGYSIINHFLGYDLTDYLEKKIISIVGNGLLDKISFDEKQGIYSIQTTLYKIGNQAEINRIKMDKSGNILSKQTWEAQNYSDLPDATKKAIVQAIGMVPIDESKITKSTKNDETVYEIAIFNSEKRFKITFSKDGTKKKLENN